VDYGDGETKTKGPRGLGILIKLGGKGPKDPKGHVDSESPEEDSMEWDEESGDAQPEAVRRLFEAAKEEDWHAAAVALSEFLDEC